MTATTPGQKLTIEQAVIIARRLARTGQLGQACDVYEQILSLAPLNEAARTGLKTIVGDDTLPRADELEAVSAALASGKAADAHKMVTELAQRFPEAAVVHYVLGVILAGAGQLGDAEVHFSRAVELDPDHVEAHNNLGIILAGSKRLQDAVAHFQQAVELEPDYADAHSNLGKALNDLDRPVAAAASCRRAIEIRPDFAGAHNNLANALQAMGDLPAAIGSYKKARQFAPRDAMILRNLGDAFVEAGSPAEARQAYLQALDVQPGYAQAHRMLSLVTDYALGDEHIDAMKRLLAAGETSDADKAQLCFGLAKAYDDLGSTEECMRYLVEGNRLRKAQIGYRVEPVQRQVAQIRQLFETASSVSQADIAEGRRPIFIVGMPRSGTSLVEQILASHTAVYGGGELPALRPACQKALENAATSAEAMAALRQDYLTAMADLGISAPVFTDKLPLNFLWIGFICKAFPDAAIVHVRRDARATCWSIFRQYFTGGGNGFAYDMTDLAQFFWLYDDLMTFWRERYAERLFDLDYEALTENQEAETRKLLDHCGLAWEDACLEFHKTERAVRTASATQVRREMYSGSSQAWRKYEAYLQPLLDGLTG